MTNMKNKLSLLFILVLIFLAFVVVRFFILDKQNEYGKIKIISSPTASIFINSTFAGKTSFEDKYKVGEYLLKLIPETNATDTASWNGKINIYKNSLTYVNRELGSSDIASAGEIFTTTRMTKQPQKSESGEIYVETEPQGAIITLDSDEKGVAPAIMENVMKGDHELSVFMPGFFRRTQKVNVDPGYRVNAAFKLAIDESATPIKVAENKQATDSAKTTKTKITIKNTPTGWLRVREEPTLNASESGRVNPGDEFSLIEEQEGWAKIEFQKGKTGWVSSQYIEKKED